jgi:hypothetical protein
MSDERRERYATAIDETFVYSTDFDAEKAADAVMAVADAERESMHTQHCMEAGEEVARLTAENARLRAEIGTEVGGISSGMHADVAEAQSAWEDECNENARLRAELESLRGEWTEQVAVVVPGAGWVRAGAIEVRTVLSDPVGVFHVRMAPR